MNIKHVGLLSSVRERRAVPKNKNHAQDGRTLIEEGDQRPAILPWSLDFGWRPSFRKSRAPCPFRPVAGLPRDALFQGHAVFCFMSVCMIGLESRNKRVE